FADLLPDEVLLGEQDVRGRPLDDGEEGRHACDLLALLLEEPVEELFPDELAFVPGERRQACDLIRDRALLLEREADWRHGIGEARHVGRVLAMEGGFGFPFGGDPEELMRGLREFAEQQAEAVHESQREQFATLTLNTAVELTAAALQQLHMEGSPDVQAIAM